MDPIQDGNLSNQGQDVKIPPVLDSLDMMERNKIQAALIEEFCEITQTDDEEIRNLCAGDWIEKYADNFPQLDAELIGEFRKAEGADKKAVLKKIQAKLEELDEING